ncbi:hypothetical protein ThvES_00011410 [Thiovulum sp. ES]|nr:hypothetical protein ThvES_00011410 [Thiovulum sp. ES]
MKQNPLALAMGSMSTEDERILFIHHKLKEADSEKNQNQKN